MKSEQTPRARLARQTFKLYLRQVMRMPVRFVMSYVWSTLFILANDITTPLIMGALVDALIKPQRDTGHIYGLLWLLAGTIVVAFVAARITFWFRNRLITTTERNLSMLVFDAYERQEYSFYTNNFVGSLVARAQRFISTFKDLYDTSVFSGLNLVLQFVVPVVILWVKAPALAAVFVGAATFIVTVIWVTNRYKLPILRENAAKGSEVTGALADVLTNNLAVKVFARRGYERERFGGVTEERRATYLHLNNVSEVIRSIRTVGGAGFQLAAAVVLVWLALHDRISVGMIVVTQMYLMRLEDSLWNLSRISERLEESMADAAEMTEVILRDPHVTDADGSQPLKVTKGAIAFEHVTFRYHDATDDQTLFSDLTLAIKPGQKVGLVGPSGGGKTTLTKLLLRFTDINDGAITIDDQDIAKVRQDDVRSNIAYVPQEPMLFHRSIRENIAYGNPDATDKEVEEAAKLAHAASFIKQLPDGYDTLVGERGVKLSGGEKQRVAIARAMLKKSPIVVLDEATSALDSKSEKAIVAALDNLMNNRTTIVIAHRLSTIRKLDRIVVLKDGKIAEDGPHAKLLKQHGTYAELWQHQSGEFLPEE